MPWKVHYEPAPPKVKGRGRSADAGTLTATYTEDDGAFTFVVTEKNFEPDDESSRNDFVARAKGELKVIKDAEQKMDELLNAGTPPAA
jgi:hypothetical protein